MIETLTVRSRCVVNRFFFVKEREKKKKRKLEVIGEEGYEINEAKRSCFSKENKIENRSDGET